MIKTAWDSAITGKRLRIILDMLRLFIHCFVRRIAFRKGRVWQSPSQAAAASWLTAGQGPTLDCFLARVLWPGESSHRIWWLLVSFSPIFLFLADVS